MLKPYGCITKSYRFHTDSSVPTVRARRNPGESWTIEYNWWMRYCKNPMPKLESAARIGLLVSDVRLRHGQAGAAGAHAGGGAATAARRNRLMRAAHRSRLTFARGAQQSQLERRVDLNGAGSTGNAQCAVRIAHHGGASERL